MNVLAHSSNSCLLLEDFFVSTRFLINVLPELPVGLDHFISVGMKGGQDEKENRLVQLGSGYLAAV